jgi:hypothetical protein
VLSVGTPQAPLQKQGLAPGRTRVGWAKRFHLFPGGRRTETINCAGLFPPPRRNRVSEECREPPLHRDRLTRQRRAAQPAPANLEDWAGFSCTLCQKVALAMRGCMRERELTEPATLPQSEQPDTFINCQLLVFAKARYAYRILITRTFLLGCFLQPRTGGF